MKICFATSNINKLNEVKKLVPSLMEIVSLDDLNFTEEIPEVKDTFEGNAIDKAIFIYQKFGIKTFADDSGLEVNALNGAPGVYSARYAGSRKEDKVKNLDLLLKNMEDKKERSAQFRTVIAFIDGDTPQIFEGKAKGKITYSPKGSKGFGYDPIFIPDGYNQTFAEMSLEDKNMISHRAIAFKKFSMFLTDY